MKLLDIISIFVVLANLSLGFFVWWKGRKKKANIWFFLLMLSTSGWVLFNRISGDIKNYQTLLVIDKITFLFPVLIVLFFIFFVLEFPRLIKVSRYFKIIIIGISQFFAVFSFSNLIVKDSIVLNGLLINDTVYGPLYNLYGIYLIFYFILGYYFLFKQLRNTSGIESLKTKYLLSAFIIATFFGLFTNLIYPMLVTHGIESQYLTVSPFGPLMTVIIAVFITYSIVRYRFMDIKVVIRKGVVHFISITIILFLYLYLLFFTQRYFVDTYHWNNQTSIVVLVLIIALTIEPLRRFLFKVVDKVFYSHRKNAREEARKLRLILSSSMQFDQLIKKVKSELQSFLDVQTAQFLWHDKRTGRLENYYKEEARLSFGPTDPLFHYLREHPDILITEEIPYMAEEAVNAEQEVLQQIRQTLEKLNVGLVCPVGERGELVGAFLFGLKSRKEAFTSDNVQYLSGLQFQLTGAIMNALLYKQAVERIATINR